MSEQPPLTATTRVEFDFRGERYHDSPVRVVRLLWNTYREHSGRGVSQIGNGVTLLKEGRVIGHISYNGRVWDADGNEVKV